MLHYKYSVMTSDDNKTTTLSEDKNAFYEYILKWTKSFCWVLSSSLIKQDIKEKNNLSWVRISRLVLALNRSWKCLLLIMNLYTIEDSGSGYLLDSSLSILLVLTAFPLTFFFFFKTSLLRYKWYSKILHI